MAFMTFLFIIGGLISLGVAAIIYYTQQIFFARNSRKIPGKVVDIIEHEFTSKDAMGHTNDVTNKYQPIIEFSTDKRYQFEADIDAQSQSLTVGSDVTVIMNEAKFPGVARLAEEAKTMQLLMVVFTALGAIFTLIGLVVFDFSRFISALSEPFSLLLMIGVLLFLLFIARKVWRMMRDFPLLPANLTEVENN